MTKYAIFWKSLATGAKGNGEFIEWSSPEEAKSSVASLNREYSGQIYHWLVTENERNPRPFERLASRVKNPRKLAVVLLWYGISAAFLFWLSTQEAAVFWPNAAIFAVCFAVGRLIAKPGQS
jgi:hypothetical protein